MREMGCWELPKAGCTGSWGSARDGPEAHLTPPQSPDPALSHSAFT